MVVFAGVLLIFFNHQPLSVLTNTYGLETQANGNYLPVFAVAAFMSLFVVYGFDTAGTYGEETIDASRQAPRGILSAILISGIIGAIFLLAIILSTRTFPARSRPPAPVANPIADAIHWQPAATSGATSTCSSSSPPSSCARWRSRAPRRG